MRRNDRMLVLDMALAPLQHGSLGIWDEIISWTVFILVVAVVGAFFYQQWRERDDEEEIVEEYVEEYEEEQTAPNEPDRPASPP